MHREKEKSLQRCEKIALKAQRNQEDQGLKSSRINLSRYAGNFRDEAKPTRESRRPSQR